MKLKILLFFLLFVFSAKSQKASRIGSGEIEKGGVYFEITGFFELNGGSNGLKSAYTFSLDHFTGSVTYAKGVRYKGKLYEQWAFGNALQPFLQALRVNTINAKARVESLNCSVDGFFLQYANNGASQTLSCSKKNDATLHINEVTITDIGVSGLNELHNEIDKQESKLEVAKKEKENEQKKAAELQKYQEETLNRSSTNNNTSPNKTTKTDAWGAPIKSGNQAPVSKQNAERTTSFDNYNQPIIKVNANGYNTEGQYVGVGKVDKTPGNIFPTGPGKLRVDGLYDVTDKNGNVHIISKSENQKLINQQTDKDVTANMQLRQQQQMQQFQQQQQKFQQQQAANRIREQQISAAADQFAKGIGTIAGAIGNIIADSKAKKERERQRLYQIEQQRIAEYNRIKAEQDFRRNSRSSLIAEYREGSLPLSTSKVAADKIYYFVYAYDSTKLDQQGMPYFVSNIVEIARSGDGTWPYQRTINEEIEPLTPYKEYFHGYYLSEAQAEQALQTFKSILSETGASGNEISFRKKKKVELKTSENSNFWNNTVSTDKKKDSITSIPKTTDPLWDVNSEINNKKTAPVKKEIDFWTTNEPEKVKLDSVLINIDTVHISSIKTALLASEHKKAMDLFNKFPHETDNLEFEALRAHCLLLNDQTARALEIYKKHKGKKIALTDYTWENKIKNDINLFESKGIQHIHFPLIQSLMLF